MNAAVDVDSIVIGAGVVGLAVARALAQAGREVFVLEAEDRAGEGISSRNSGVIHAGLYYAEGSFKARCCVRGRVLLYEFCARAGVGHRRTGKLVVATNADERAALENLLPRALANGVDGLRWLEGDAAMRLEPALNCLAAIESSESGIVDVPELVMALIGALERSGGQLVCNHRVSRVVREQGAFRVETAAGDSVRCRHLVNSAGLHATEVAAMIDALDPIHVPRQYYAAGHYYRLQGWRHPDPAAPAGSPPFARLIYPVPVAAGLGVHLGFDAAGRCHFGPDVRWIPAPDYQFDDSQHAHFAESIQRWWPSLRAEQLAPDFVGVRPKLVGPGAPSGDFVLQGQNTHGIAGLVNLFGIESPGLTSCLAIAEHVRDLLT